MFALPDKTAAEIVIVTFGFGDEVPAGVTLSNAVVNVTLLSGNDPGVSLTKGGIVYQDRDVCVLVQGGIEGCKYELYCAVDTSAGEHRERQASLRISAAAV
jgi:hypothetical protein